MPSQMGKEIRMSKILHPEGPAIIVAADQGLSMGALAGLEDIESGLRKVIAAGVDALILSPGQAGREAHLFKGKQAPALLVRSDWSNVARDESFPLPRKEMAHVSVSGARHAAFLGACGVVASFYVGYRDDEDEADNLEAVSKLAAECLQYGMPLLVESIPFGDRITEHNYVDSAKMAARMSLEAGADAVITPYTGSQSSMKEIVVASGAAPVLLLLDDKDEGGVAKALRAGVKGVVMGGSIFRKDASASIKDIRELVNQGA